MKTSMLEAPASAERTSLPNEPLAIQVTVPARENVALRALVRQTIPILRNPEAYAKDTRLQLAQTLTLALGDDPGDAGEEEAEWNCPPFTDAEAPPVEADHSNDCCPWSDCEPTRKEMYIGSSSVSE